MTYAELLIDKAIEKSYERKARISPSKKYTMAATTTLMVTYVERSRIYKKPTQTNELSSIAKVDIVEEAGEGIVEELAHYQAINRVTARIFITLLLAPIVIAFTISTFIGHYAFNWALNPYLVLPVGLAAIGLFATAVVSLTMLSKEEIKTIQSVARIFHHM